MPLISKFEKVITTRQVATTKNDAHHLLRLPVECLERILKFLPGVDIARSVSHRADIDICPLSEGYLYQN